MYADTRVHAARTRQARPVAPDVPVAALPGEDTAASDERSRLVLVAGHLRHPLVLAALEEPRSKDVDSSGAADGRAVVS